MQFVMIYGPPAAGKYTVAKELARLTGYRLFHNHAVLDTVLHFFDWDTQPFNELLEKLRYDIISACAADKNIKGLIFTFCYAPPDDDPFIRKILSIMKKYGGKAHFVMLQCSREKLFRRMRQPSRKKFAKVKTAKNLKKMLSDFEFFTPIAFTKNLIIDNTKISARKVAALIRSHFNL